MSRRPAPWAHAAFFLPGVSLVLAATVLFSLSYFYQAGGWNQNSRYDLSRALVEDGSVRIDRYHRNTGDKAHKDGHFYSDKAPGQSLIAAPVLAATRMAGADPGRESGARWATYAMTVCTSAVPAALMVLAFAALGGLHRRSRGASAAAALVISVGSPMWAYATLFMGHALSASCLLGATCLAAHLRATGGSRRRRALLGAAVGVLAGWSVVTEYPALVPAVLISVYALWPKGRAGEREGVAHPGWVATVSLAGGAGLCAVLLGAYHQAAFGAPWATPLRYLELFHNVRDQPFSWPSAHALVAITVGSQRGLLFVAPVLAAGLYGLARMVREPGSRALGILSAAIVVYYLVLNASFATPLGGWSYGPRYLAASLPFWGLGLMWAWDAHAGRPWRALLIAAAAWGVLCALVVVSTTAQPPESFIHPLGDLAFPAFASGDLSLNHQSFLEAAADPARLRGGLLAHDAFNLGELVGLRGLTSLVPLAAAWVAVTVLLWRRGLRARGGAG